uniref:Serpentine receptor class gamma n=1 Tax=Panagrellus redivivus TaxID=6233 RepID=A0A7E4V8W0_PANRE
MPGFSFDISGFVSVKVHDPRHIVYHTIGLFLTMLSSTIVLISFLKFWNFARHNRIHLSEATKEAMTQMSIILSIQATVPFILCFVPISVFMLSSFLFHEDSIIPMMTIPAISLFPIINSILVTVFMKSYRNFILLKLEKVMNVLCVKSK